MTKKQFVNPTSINEDFTNAGILLPPDKQVPQRHTKYIEGVIVTLKLAERKAPDRKRTVTNFIKVQQDLIKTLEHILKRDRKQSIHDGKPFDALRIVRERLHLAELQNFYKKL
jgi:hypothetical protein